MAAKIPFNRGEMKNAWQQNLAASKSRPRNNAHRLLLFYAVECGLKAVIMEREKLTRTDQSRGKAHRVDDFGHDINHLLDELRMGAELRLRHAKINTIKSLQSKKAEERAISPEKINQMWRYGGKSIGISDEEFEKDLLKINEWIKEEIR